jgi:hypothetical protein
LSISDLECLCFLGPPKRAEVKKEMRFSIAHVFDFFSLSTGSLEASEMIVRLTGLVCSRGSSLPFYLGIVSAGFLYGCMQ